MATYTKNYQFIEDLAHKVHDLSTDALTYYLTNNTEAPVQTDSVLLDINPIAYTNLPTSRVCGTPTTAGQTTGTYTFFLPDKVLTATGAVATFRWCGIYNDDTVTPTDALICYWDYGSDVTLANNETFTIDYTTSTFTLDA